MGSWREVEKVVIDPQFWSGRRVFLTGHTGFKGTWTILMLRRLGAKVTGFALPARDRQQLFELAGCEAVLERHYVGDVRDLDVLRRALDASESEIAIHMAAQSLVRLSYAEPVKTYASNVMGTVHFLEAVRQAPSVRAAIVVTSDKCYENSGSVRRYREDDRMGGHDPYSNSKGCAELVTDGYRKSFFAAPSRCHIASVRAGNVIGGGDWAPDRLVPDAMRAFGTGRVLQIRNPCSVRPWQHVLDPVAAYLHLAERLVESGAEFAEGWNFGPSAASEITVLDIVRRLTQLWSDSAKWQIESNGDHRQEAAYLKLDCAKASSRLQWQPIVELDLGLRWTVDWYRTFYRRDDLLQVTLAQLDEFFSLDGMKMPHALHAST